MASLSSMGNLPLHYLAVLFCWEIKKTCPITLVSGENFFCDCRWFFSLG